LKFGGKFKTKSGDGVTVAKGKMNLKQAINFLSQSHTDITAARIRLDKAVKELAGFISEKGLPGERVVVNDVIYEIAEISSSIDGYKYLAVDINRHEDEKNLKSLENIQDYDLYGNINMRILASNRTQRLEFALNCNEILIAFGEMWREKAARFNAGAVIAKANN
jgi:hypothetical protein